MTLKGAEKILFDSPMKSGKRCSPKERERRNEATRMVMEEMERKRLLLRSETPYHLWRYLGL